MGFKYLTYVGEMCGEYTALNIVIGLKCAVHILYIQSNSRLPRYSLTTIARPLLRVKLN